MDEVQEQQNTSDHVQNAQLRKRSLRMNWKQFQKFRGEWDKMLQRWPQAAAFSTLEDKSNIYASFQSQTHMFIALMNTPTAKINGIDKAVEGLKFFKGLPIVAIDQKAAEALRSKRTGLKPSSTWTKLHVRYDEHGAIVAPAKEIAFDKEKCVDAFNKYQARLEERKDKEQEKLRPQIVAAESVITAKELPNEYNADAGQRDDETGAREQSV